MNKFQPTINDLIELFRQTLRDLSNVTRAIAMHPDFTSETAQSIAEAMTADPIEGITITPIIDDAPKNDAPPKRESIGYISIPNPNTAPRPLPDDIKMCQNCGQNPCGAGRAICLGCAIDIYENADETVMFWDDAHDLYKINCWDDDDLEEEQTE